jgi:hypothetical protein
MEKDIILKHMWGATAALPKYRESVVVSLVDDKDAVVEFLSPMKKRAMAWRKRNVDRVLNLLDK